jgi:hypothetical protein
MNAEEVLLDTLAGCFYEVVPHEWRTYCSLTSRIARAVLRHYEVPAELTPAQLWYAMPNGNCIVGFVDRPLPRDKWNGHVVCTTPNGLLDTATATLTRSFGLNFPWTAMTRRFKASSHAIARVGVGEQGQLWWFNPPAGFDIVPPEEPSPLIEPCVESLIQRVETRMRQRPDSMQE